MNMGMNVCSSLLHIFPLPHNPPSVRLCVSILAMTVPLPQNITLETYIHVYATTLNENRYV